MLALLCSKLHKILNVESGSLIRSSFATLSDCSLRTLIIVNVSFLKMYNMYIQTYVRKYGHCGIGNQDIYLPLPTSLNASKTPADPVKIS